MNKQMTDGQVLREILEELKKINEYIDIQKAKEVNRINNAHLSSKNTKSEQVTFQEVLKVSRQCLQE